MRPTGEDGGGHILASAAGKGGVMSEAAGFGSFVVARLSFSKGDLYLIETVRRFPTETLAKEWMRDEGYEERSGGGWPDWIEYWLLRREGERYLDLSGAPVGTIQGMG